MRVADSNKHREAASGGPVAVVGSNCPLGRHLVEGLLAAGRTVHAFCRVGWSVPWQWTTHRAFRSAEFDLVDATALARGLESASQIVWLPQLREECDRSGGPDSNVHALHLVCEQAPRHPRKIVLLSSGGSVYGNPVSLPVPETHPCRPIGPYGLSKKRLEDCLRQNIERTPGLSGVVLRSANIYGAYWLEMGARGCIGAFSRSLLAGDPVTLIAGGKALRDFVHVSDVNCAIVAALACEQRLAIWNVGSGVGVEILEVLCAISQILNRAPSAIIPINARPSDVDRIVLDIGRIKRESSWRPSVPLYEGLRSVLSAKRLSRATEGQYRDLAAVR
ncbi:MAG: NAD-dependent epimerase/dehydratase family protein [Candidatus Sulfotelmatobacter sp.]